MNCEHSTLQHPQDYAAAQQPVVSERKQAVSELSDDELEIHIEDAHWQYRTAYERFELHGIPHDREEALAHLHRRDAAILARSPAVQAARHAEFERRLTEQVAFFNSDTAVAMGQPGRRLSHA